MYIYIYVYPSGMTCNKTKCFSMISSGTRNGQIHFMKLPQTSQDISMAPHETAQGISRDVSHPPNHLKRLPGTPQRSPNSPQRRRRESP